MTRKVAIEMWDAAEVRADIAEKNLLEERQGYLEIFHILSDPIARKLLAQLIEAATDLLAKTGVR